MHAERRKKMLSNLCDSTCCICLEELVGTEAHLESVECDSCGSIQGLMRCKCKLKYYCSRQCQKKQWKKHKGDCQSWVKEAHTILSLPCGHRLHQHCVDQL